MSDAFEVPDDLADGETLKVRYEGGSTSDLDVPPTGTTQREHLEDAIAKGRVVILERGIELPEPQGDGGDGPERPTDKSSKADWVAYVVHLGADPDEAEKLSKAKLAEVVEYVEATADTEPQGDGEGDEDSDSTEGTTPPENPQE